MQSGGEANHEHRKVRRFAILIDLSEVVVAKTFIGDYTPRPSSAGPLLSASQVPPPMVSGIPAPLPPPLLLPLQELKPDAGRRLWWR